MNFDLAALEQTTRNIYDVTVGHQAGEDGKPDLNKPVGFRVLGPSSPEYTKVERDIQIERVKVANTTDRKTVDLNTDMGAATVVDRGDKYRDMVVMACTVDWFGFVDGGQPAPFTPENLRRVLTARPAWVKKLLAEIEEQANFDVA